MTRITGVTAGCRRGGPRDLPNARSRGQGGFSLIEMLIASSLLAAGLVALSHLSIIAAFSATRAHHLTFGVPLAAQKIEQLRALCWSYDTLGLAVSDESSDVSVTPASPTGGRGLLASPGGSLASNVAGYVDFLDRHGEWIGSGSSPPAGTAYVRRWSVEPDPGDPANVVVLRVLVLPVAAARRADTDPGSGVLVVGAKARKYG